MELLSPFFLELTYARIDDRWNYILQISNPLSGGRYKSAILRKPTGILGDHGESPDIVELN
jgi:hypothetical protein